MDLPQSTGIIATVLLAEDDTQLRPYIATVLQHQGFLVIEACDGTEALQMFRAYSGEIDLLLTDMNLGDGLDGVSLACELLLQHPALAVLVISGEGEGKQAAAERGFSFLGKPFTPVKLAESVREALGGRRVPPNHGRSAGGGR